MTVVYKPDAYWEDRLSERFNLSGVGHISFSEFYNRWIYKAKLRVLKKAFHENGINVCDKTVCDIGCGTGFFVDFYSRNNVKELLGIDIAQISVENLKSKYPQYNFLKSDISTSASLSTVNQRFDIVNIFDVLYHIKDDASFNKAISNISSLVGPGDFILITDMYGDCDIDIADHVRFRGSDTYREVLQNNDISIISAYPVYYLLNRYLLGSLLSGKMGKLGKKADNMLASLYYFLDGFIMSKKRSNLKLIVARKN
ncbi:MAG: class I SAM-dependent methyltransferase [Nitrospinales bacterium]